jgi:hypothetical protein
MSEKRELPRAELVRQRRERENTRRLEQASKRAYKPEITVTSRNRGHITAKQKRVTHERRFNIALGLSNLHLQRPRISLPKLLAGWRPTSLFITFVLCAALYLAWTLPYFHATWANVQGNSRLTVDEINAVLGISGQSIFTIQPEEVETRLRLNYPELASAEVTVYLPNHVFVNVTERQPVILWQQGEGYTWIDATGLAFRPRGVVTGLIPVLGNGVPPAGIASPDDPLSPPPFLTKEMVEAILLLSPTVPAGTMMVYDPLNGLGWNDARGWQVFFGTDAKDMALKIRVYQSLVDSLTARGLSPIFVSVAYANAPYYRMSQPTIATESNQ